MENQKSISPIGNPNSRSDEIQRDFDKKASRCCKKPRENEKEALFNCLVLQRSQGRVISCNVRAVELTTVYPMTKRWWTFAAATAHIIWCSGRAGVRQIEQGQSEDGGECCLYASLEVCNTVVHKGHRKLFRLDGVISRFSGELPEETQLMRSVRDLQKLSVLRQLADFTCRKAKCH
jgi:hypothetical protein